MKRLGQTPEGYRTMAEYALEQLREAIILGELNRAPRSVSTSSPARWE